MDNPEKIISNSIDLELMMRDPSQSLWLMPEPVKAPVKDKNKINIKQSEVENNVRCN